MSSKYDYQSTKVHRHTHSTSDRSSETGSSKHSKSEIGSSLLGALLGAYLGRARGGDKLAWMTAAAVGALGARETAKHVKKRRTARDLD